jgi:hypothetical protein
MIKKKVLIVAIYPIANPQHGGQKRVKAIFEYYKNIFSEVKFVGVYHRSLYEDHGKDDILLGQPDIISKIDQNPQAVELITGEAIANDIHVRSHMAKLLFEYKPDIIQIEQVFPYLGLALLLKDINMAPRLVLSSQNIEYIMKEAIYKKINLPNALAKELVERTKKLEHEATKKSDLVIAVSEEDAKAHKQLGANRCIVMPNGINKVIPSKKALNHWEKFYKHNNMTSAINCWRGIRLF